MSKHYPLTAELAKQLRSAKLTAAEWQVWTYLVTLDPFGDRYQELDLMTILTDCDISKPTLYRAIARLQELELIDTQPVKFAFRNLVGARNLLSENSIKDDTPVSKMRKQSQKRDSSIKNETTVSGMRKQSQKRDKLNLEPLPDIDPETPQTIQTDQTLKTLSNSPSNPKNSERDADLFDQEGEPIAPYKAWLLRKADKLPNPIGFIELWLEKNARKSSLIKAYRKIQNQSSAAPSPSQVDSNSVIAGIDGELARLSWSRDQAIAHMVECFEWRKIAFDRIVDDDLLTLLNELEQMESEGEL
jgi:hypothetical protein